MVVLGIETATQICGAALARDGQLLCEYRSQVKNAHERVLAPAIEQLLRDAHVQLADIDGIAISIGPGSFTGLRIGLATAKGIAYAIQRPIVAVPTLEALAQQAPTNEGLICPLIRSRAGEVYAALFRRKDGIDHLVHDVVVLSTTELVRFLPEKAMVIGQCEDLPIEGLLSVGCTQAAAPFGLLSAYTIAHLGTQRLLKGQTEKIETLEPFYRQEFIVGKPRPAAWKQSNSPSQG